MKKKFSISRRIVAAVMASFIAMTTLSACSDDSDAPDQQTDKHYVIGVIPFNDTAAEQLDWNNYLTEYVAKNYNIEFKFATAPGDAESAVTVVEELKLAGAEAILGIVDYPAAIQKANELEMWYIRAGGLSTLSDYEQIKDLPYYLGTMGPSLDEEYQAGYDMIESYVKDGKKDILVFAAILGLYLPSDMHVFRFEGMRDALVAAGAVYTPPASGSVVEGPGVGEFASGTSGLNITTIYGYPIESIDSTFHDRFTQAVSGKTFDAVAMTAEGSQNVNTWLNGAGITGVVIGEVSSFNATAGEAFETGILGYVVGKYGSSMGPAVIALINALDGHADIMRNADGTGARLTAPFWAANSSADFAAKRAFDDNADPAFNKAIMDKYIVRLNPSVTRTSFIEFAGFSFDDLKALH
ncbi:MAG: hypothetical protein LBJ43_01555 [Propionibacteriaceae bacterium]|jgi:hypothetical protein|nr:hypothetical protein [Propionibacteriaceae bacterium]